MAQWALINEHVINNQKILLRTTEDTYVIQPDSSMVDQIIFEAVYPIRGI
jgi:hypothetical protein